MLYPHMSVRQNMGYGLQIAGVPKAQINAKVEEAAKLLQLKPSPNREPRQRVAMGRALVRKLAVVLFDAPLADLDAKHASCGTIHRQPGHERVLTADCRRGGLVGGGHDRSDGWQGRPRQTWLAIRAFEGGWDRPDRGAQPSV